jgi:iron complex transport system substrate-binding protein
MPQHRRTLAALVLVLLVFVVPACGDGGGPGSEPTGSEPTEVTTAPPETTEPPAAFPMTLTDDDGVEVTLDAEPQRIITFAPSITEIVFALGAGDRLVGVSGEFDDHPEEATSIDHVGGAGEFGVDPNLEKVVSLEPDLFLTIKGGDAWKEQLRELGIVVFTANAEDFDDLLADTRTIGELLGPGPAEAATALTAALDRQAAEISTAVSEDGPVTCFFEVYYGPPVYTVGPNTYLADLLRMAGCDLVSGSARSDYPTWSVEKLVASSPDVYIVTDEGVASIDDVAARPGYDAIAAVSEGRVFMVSSDLVSRAGPRVVDGLRQLAEALHPEALAAA